MATVVRLNTLDGMAELSIRLFMSSIGFVVDSVSDIDTRFVRFNRDLIKF